MRNGNHRRMKNGSKYIYPIVSSFMPSVSQLYFMVENNLLSCDLVTITLAEQASEQSRKRGNPYAARVQHLTCRRFCSRSTLKTRQVLWLDCALLQLLFLLGTLCISFYC